MESRSKLIRNAYDNYKLAPISSWIIGLTTGILIAAILAIDLAMPFMSVLTFPLLALPILFSSTLQHLLLKTKGQINISTSFKGFAIYFTRLYRGSFRYLFSLLISFIIFVALEMTVSFVATMILQLTSTTFVDAINNFYAVIYSDGFTLQEFSEAFMAYDGILFKYFCSTILPALFITVFVLVYNISRSSLMIFHQMNHPTLNPRFTRFVYTDVLRRNRVRMALDYWALNWPLYVLLLLGFGCGAYLGYLWGQNYSSFYSDVVTTMVSCGFVFGAVGASLFMPFYFSNQEVLFDSYKDEFEVSMNNVTNFMLQNIQRNIDLSNEEKERLKQSLIDTNVTLEDKGEDDNKKDPEGS